MHIECEKSAGSNPREARRRAGRRASRRGSATTSPAPAARQDKASTGVTLEHVQVAARRRLAPISAETAGYVALAVADALAAAPAQVRPMLVHIDADGNVLLRGASGRGDEAAAEHSVRAMLAGLLAVAAGGSPALAAAARRSSTRGIEGLVLELEAALIPVNRAAARRAIGRLAREVERADVQLPDRSTRRATAPAKATPPPPREPAPPAKAAPAPVAVRQEPSADVADLASTDSPPEATVSPVPVEAQEPVTNEAADTAAAVAVDDVVDEATDIDAPVVPVDLLDVQLPPEPAISAPTPSVEPSDATPPLASYDPHAAAGVEVLGPADPVEHDASFLDDDDDLLTYEPPEALGDESLDFGTASPPDVGLAFPEDEATADSQQQEETAQASESEPQLQAQTEREPEAQTGPRTDRVEELLAGFASPPGRSSRDVAVEIKGMLGLAPTPAPPPGEEADPSASPPEPEPPGEPSEPAPLPPVEFRRPRNPKLNLLLMTVLLVLAIAGMVTLYVLYPAMLVGH